MIHWSRGRTVAAIVAAAVVIGLLAWQALSGNGAAVIACQVLAMTTFAYGPYFVWRRRHPSAGTTDPEQRGRATEERDR